MEENRLACPIQQRHKNKLADRQTDGHAHIVAFGNGETLQIPVFSECVTKLQGIFAALSTETPLNAAAQFWTAAFLWHASLILRRKKIQTSIFQEEYNAVSGRFG